MEIRIDWATGSRSQKRFPVLLDGLDRGSLYYLEVEVCHILLLPEKVCGYSWYSVVIVWLQWSLDPHGSYS